MANILVTETRRVKRGVKRRTLSEHVHIGSVSLTLILIVFTAIVSTAYLLMANKSATIGYTFKQLHAERSNLLLTSEKWDKLIADSKSLESIEQNPLVADMVKNVDQPYFIQGDRAVATKNK